jgi:ribosomal protein L28
MGKNIMGRRCEICQRGSKKSFSRSHSNIATGRRQHVNLQSLIKDDKKYKACTSCIKNYSKAK